MFESRIIELEKIDLHVLEAGDPVNPTIVFLHGFPEYNAMWAHQLDYFSALGYHVLAPDMRGFNRSEKPKKVSDYAVHELARDVKALVGHFDKDQFSLVGHDLGGMVAWHLSIVFPEMLDKVVIINMPHMDAYRNQGLRNLTQLARSWYVFFFQLPFIPEQVARLSNYKILANSMQSTSISGTFSDEDIDLLIESWKHENAFGTMLNVYRAALRHRFDYRNYQKGRVPVPLKIIWGEKDQFLIKKLADYSVEYCDHGELEYWEDATHWIVKEMPGLINKSIRRFLEAN